MVGYYSFIAATLQEDEDYELDAPDKWGLPPLLTPASPDQHVLAGPEISDMITVPAESGAQEVAQ